jgi:hypothetical protein
VDYKKFMSKIGNVLSKPATLEVPNGNLGRTELLKCDNGIVYISEWPGRFCGFVLS